MAAAGILHASPNSHERAGLDFSGLGEICWEEEFAAVSRPTTTTTTTELSTAIEPGAA